MKRFFSQVGVTSLELPVWKYLYIRSHCLYAAITAGNNGKSKNRRHVWKWATLYAPGNKNKVLANRQQENQCFSTKTYVNHLLKSSKTSVISVGIYSSSFHDSKTRCCY